MEDEQASGSASIAVDGVHVTAANMRCTIKVVANQQSTAMDSERSRSHCQQFF